MLPRWPYREPRKVLSHQPSQSSGVLHSGKKKVVTVGPFRALGPCRCFISFKWTAKNSSVQTCAEDTKKLRTTFHWLSFSLLGLMVAISIHWILFGGKKMLLIWLHMQFAYLCAEGYALLGHDRRWSIYHGFSFLSPQAEQSQST